MMEPQVLQQSFSNESTSSRPSAQASLAQEMSIESLWERCHEQSLNHKHFLTAMKQPVDKEVTQVVVGIEDWTRRWKRLQGLGWVAGKEVMEKKTGATVVFFRMA